MACVRWPALVAALRDTGARCAVSDYADIRLVVLSRLSVGEEFARFRARRKSLLSKTTEKLTQRGVAQHRKESVRYRHRKDYCGVKLVKRGNCWSCPACGEVFR